MLSLTERRGLPAYANLIRISERYLFYYLQLIYWHFIEILWLFIFIIFYFSKEVCQGWMWGANFFEGKSRGNDKDNQEISKGMQRVTRWQTVRSYTVAFLSDKFATHR